MHLNVLLLSLLLVFSPQQSDGQMIPGKPDIVVAQDGSGGFRTVREGLEAAEVITGRTGRLVVYVKAGVYYEKVQVAQTLVNFTMIGDGIGRTIISCNRSAATDGSGFQSATVSVHADGFVAVGITFRNTYGRTSQAVAMMTVSDRSVYYKCSFEGYQDTLYVHSGKQFYRECDIYGTIDFIYGDASAVFQMCNIYFRRPLPGQSNVITAQGRSSQNEISGTVIHNCFIKAEPEVIPPWVTGRLKSYLGRPWHEASRVVYLKNYMEVFIDPAGWITATNKNLGLNTSYFAEFQNRGPGSDVSRRVHWPGYHVLTDPKIAEQFTVGRFIGGESWISVTGVPFKSDL